MPQDFSLDVTSEPTVALVRDAMSRFEDTGRLSQLDTQLLFSARDGELDRLLHAATSLRDKGLDRSGRSGVITYSKKVFIPITYLCRDRCHYCTFVETPGGLAAQGKPTFMSPEEILEIAREGAALGCKEALFTLGDRPEDRWPIARQWLDQHGYDSTLDYIRAMAILVLEETGLLPHLNPGVMSWAELQRLRPVAPSMGMMLETTSARLWNVKGGVHYGSPDKDPALRLRVLEDAGRARVPFTTGVLLGIGENNAERAESLFAIRASHERWGHIQETIVQNFRAKDRTAMQNEKDLELQEYVAAVAVARLVMGADATVQAPPNLTDANELGLLLRAGIDDWGGVSPLTADHVNPERPWPDLDDLARLTAAEGFDLRERLTAHPQYVNDPEGWVDPRIREHLGALADSRTGLANESAPVVGRLWAEPAGGARAGRATFGVSSEAASTLRRAAANPAGLADQDYLALLRSDGAALDELAAVADEVRARALGDGLTFAVNRNIDSTLWRAERPDDAGRTLDPAMLRDLVDEARGLGATEICVQGAIPAHLPGEAYLDLVAAVRERQPDMHLHAFRPTEIADGAARLGISRREFLEALRDAGVNSVPGTGARILDDRVRAVLSENTDPPVGDWIESVTMAHRAGLRSTATMVFGHLETPTQQVAHLRALAAIQDTTGGFTEFIPMPFMPREVPAAVAAIAGNGPDERQIRAVHAVARLMLHGRIDHVQSAWTKIGLRGSERVLRGGADDMGGLLLDGFLWPEAGAEAYRELTVADMEQLASTLGRTPRQRATDYGTPAFAPLVSARTARASAVTRLRLPLRERADAAPTTGVA